MWIIIRWLEDGTPLSSETYIDQNMAYQRFANYCMPYMTEGISLYRVKDFGWKCCDTFRPKNWTENK